jgi:hypothetical protein
MGKKFRIELDGIDVGQIVDGITSRAESWQKTADFLETGYSFDDSFVCEECSDADEATKIAAHFSSIAACIQRQVTEQGGW